MKNPLISIITPSYNCANTIITSIESSLNQTYKNIEIVIIDDNSTDNTKEIVEEFINKIKSNKVKYYQLPFNDPNRLNSKGRNINAGYMARNYGLDKINGEWVTFHDADDAALLNKIEVQYNLALKHNSHHVCVQSQKFSEKKLGKKLDVNKILEEKSDVFLDSKNTYTLSKKTKGIIIPFLGKLNEYIPFKIKQMRIINKLFFRSLSPYPGGNSTLVKTEIAKKIKFQPLNKRIWPSFTGRGVDRDFNFRIAEKYKNSIIYDFPLFLWRQDIKNDRFESYSKFLY